jgi:prophage regulatory protein
MKIIKSNLVRELTGMSQSTIDRQEKGNNFPKRVKIGKRAVGWYECEVLEWIATRQRCGNAA